MGNKPKVLISTSSFGKADSSPLDLCCKYCEVVLNPYGRKLTTEEFIELTSDVDGVIAGVEQITAEALHSRNNIRVISRCGVGMDSVDQNACKEMGIVLYNTPNAPVDSVAETTVTFILMLLKNIIPMDKAMKNGNWNKNPGFMLQNKTVGIIGMGRIGKRVAELLKPFNVEIIYTDISDQKSEYKCVSKDVLLEESDIITIHVSGSEDAKYIIGKDELSKMKKTAFLVNTSRGTFVDESALHDSLINKDIAGAALDVFSVEPYKEELIDLDNVILTPHISSSAKEGRLKMEHEAVVNLLKGFDIKVD